MDDTIVIDGREFRDEGDLEAWNLYGGSEEDIDPLIDFYVPVTPLA